MLSAGRLQNGQAMSLTIVELTTIAITALLGAGILLILSSYMKGAPRSSGHLSASIAAGPAFLFQDGMLIDSTADAGALPGYCAGQKSELSAMIGVLDGHFPTLRDVLKNPATSSLRIRSEVDELSWIDIDQSGGTVRLSLNGRHSGAQANTDDGLTLNLQQAELLLLRDVGRHSPQLIWLVDAAGGLVWANQAYQSFAATLPPPKDNGTVFPKIHDATMPHTTSQQRVSVTPSNTAGKQWFDVSSVVRGDSCLHFANDANAVMRADEERREFVQTLGKTFAQLAIGLAIFDKNRQLAMFNPALLDMTHLPVEFLSARPTIDTVLDRLRESRMMPEPKNYSSWRDSFTAVETAAKNGTYSENWTLPDGQVYRVTGRPHPGGAFAFLFEDISAEVSLTRRFRSDIETGQSVLDNLPDAIAVFSGAGTLVMSNTAYANLWSTNHELLLEHRALQSEMETWQDQCIPTSIWGEMRAYIQQQGSRKSWSDDVILDDGRQLRCHANPLAGGMTMVRFTMAQPMRPAIRKLAPSRALIQVSKR